MFNRIFFVSNFFACKNSNNIFIGKLKQKLNYSNRDSHFLKGKKLSVSEKSVFISNKSWKLIILQHVSLKCPILWALRPKTEACT